LKQKKSAYTSQQNDSPSLSRENDSKAFDIIKNSDPSNKICAECNAPDPVWASINLGIMICLECSGIHRNMGSHISKVRSFALDKWELEVVKMMTHLGNQKVNAIYEFNIPKEIKKPTPNADHNSREQYIRLKYVQKKFVKSSNMDAQTLNQTLFDSIKSGKPLQSILELISQGSDINCALQNENNKTSLHCAVIENSILSLVLLALNGATINVLDASQKTPMHYAAELGHLACATILYKFKAKISVKDCNDKLPIDYAVENKKADCLTFLRLAQFASQDGIEDESFLEALENFAYDALIKIQ